MEASKPRPSPAQEEESPRAGAERRTPEADMQAEDSGSAAGGAANQGSPAAPVMKQFQKTDAEAKGRR